MLTRSLVRSPRLHHALARTLSGTAGAVSTTTHKFQEWAKANPSFPSAHMPPNEIYHAQDMHEVENRPGGILRSHWTYVGHTGQFAHADMEDGKYITSTLGHNLPIIITKNSKGGLAGFVNLCRHRAAVLLLGAPQEADGMGCGSFGKSITCQYHGWEYSQEGRLVKATKLKGVTGFSPKDHGLFPIDLTTMGPLIFARACQDPTPVVPGPAPAADFYPGLLDRMGGDISSHVFVKRIKYTIGCNWKVFADNYLDGGYHISRLHPGLASQLDLQSYTSETFEHHSIQSCAAGTGTDLAGNEVSDRVGPPVYAWLFPTTAINKYGPWIDVHTVQPLAPNKCLVSFDYFMEAAKLETLLRTKGRANLEAQLLASNDVQMEDIGICEQVQTGLSSGGYTPGRYAGPEEPSHHFHMLLAKYV